MTARNLSTAGVQPAPGDHTLGEFMRRLQALRALSYCDLAIAELETLPERTTADELLLANYRREASRLVSELGARVRS